MQISASTNDQLMVTAAHRYCLGRQTIAVGACLDWLHAHWPQLTSQTQLVILRDTIAALMDGEAGDPTIDVPGWRDFARWGMDRLTTEQREWVRDALSYKKKEWPL